MTELDELISRAESVKDEITAKQISLARDVIAKSDHVLYEKLLKSFEILDVFLGFVINELIEDWSVYIPSHAYGFYNE